ncbi:MAG TPA: phage baseplate assembly protein V [Candidatus Binataceae bacterium]|nr:phage baseplate assembly protein V [Candidatus Binataceae bacterium]
MNAVSPFRVGLVQEQDTAGARVRVIFPDYDRMQSYWLPVVSPKTQNDKAYWIPDVGEQVVCLMDLRDEAGAVLGAIYSAADTPPVDSADKWHLGFKDNTAFEYDRGSHVLNLSFQDGTDVTYDSGAHVLTLNFNDGTAIKYDGGLHVFSFAGASAMSATVAAPAGITLSSGSSEVTITPSGVAISPPLPTSSTVAQT